MKLAYILSFLGIIACVHAGIVVKMSDEFEMDKDEHGKMRIKIKNNPLAKPQPPPKKNEIQVRPMQTAVAFINPLVPHIHTAFGHVMRTLCGFHGEMGSSINIPGMETVCEESFLEPENLKNHLDPYLGYFTSIPKTVMEPMIQHQQIAGDFPFMNELLGTVVV